MTYTDSPHCHAQAIRAARGAARAVLVDAFNARHAHAVPAHLRGVLSPLDWFNHCSTEQHVPITHHDERPMA